MKQHLFIMKVCFLSVLLAILPIISYAMIDEHSTVILKGSWYPRPERSLFFPFTAYHDASTVTIYNDKPVCDLIIAIIDQETGAEVYSQEVSAENSGYVVIPVSDLGDGSYCLTISNPEAGYVYGYFNL